jgi:hypothetical protein
MKHYCPDCITELTPETRKLGRWGKKWLVCPNCGLRTTESQMNNLDDELSHKIAAANDVGGVKETPEDIEEFDLEELINKYYGTN